jgi:hypothetical protein
MMGRSIITIICLVISVSAMAADMMKKVTVDGMPVRVYGSREGGYVVTAGKRVIFTDDGSVAVGIESIHSGEGRTYIVISTFSGGASCCFTYYAVDMSNAEYKLSPGFELDQRLINIKVVSGALIVETLADNQKRRMSYSFYDGAFKEEVRSNSLEPTGPDSVPGGDLAAFANGKMMSDVFKAQATAKPLAKLLGKYFIEARDIALADFGGSFGEQEMYVIADNAQPHNAQHRVAIAFDHDNHLWAMLVVDDVTHSKLFFGDPGFAVRRLLER